MKKILGFTIGAVVVAIICYFLFIYNMTYSEGIRSGELIKFSNKGILFKTYEGEISEGIAGSRIFSFSVLDRDKNVIEDLKKFEGRYVKVTYVERYKSFPWWGDTNYFIIAVHPENSPFKIK
jgi:hypothetical protein